MCASARDLSSARCLGRADKPATVAAHSSDSLIKPEIPKLDLNLPPGNRDLVFSLHVFPGALVSFLQTGIVEKLSAGTVDVLNVALEHADLLGETGHRHGHGSRNQNSFQHTRDSAPVPDQLRPSIKIRLGLIKIRLDLF